MLRQRLSENVDKTPYDTPRIKYNLKYEEEAECNERKWAISGLTITFLIIAVKVFTNYSKFNLLNEIGIIEYTYALLD